MKDFATSFITPLVALIGGEPNYTHLTVTINGTEFPYGVFVTSAIAFLITASVVYFFVVLPTTKLIERMDHGKEATERECPQCLSTIPVQARRCRYCTSEFVPAAGNPHPLNR